MKVFLVNLITMTSISSKHRHHNYHQLQQRHKYPTIMIRSSYFVAFLFINLFNLTLCNYSYANEKDSENSHKMSSIIPTTTTTPIIDKYANESLLEARELFEDSMGMVWSQFLEDYILSQNPSSRASKDLPYFSELSAPAAPQYQMMINPGMGPNPSNPQAPINYHSSAYKRPNIYINKRIGEVGVELEPHKRPPQQVVNPQFRPMTNQMTQHQQPGFLQQLFGLGGPEIGITRPTQNIPTTPTAGAGISQQQIRPVPLQQQHVIHNGPQTFRAVSENDLYLLGAIEKLVYRVDYLESRVRRTEQLIYYLMAGNKQQTEVRDPCPTNFTRISDNCYYINSQQAVNWKTANTACKGLNAHLAEFEKPSENEEIMAYLLNQPNYRGRDFWLGGLNPGLLWIWSNSAKPVNPNMNLTSIAMSHKEANNNDTESNTIDVDEKVDKNKPDTSDILNNIVEIEGQGRCLRLSYNSAKHSYKFYGQECTTRHHYICEYEDKTLDNKIKKIARELKLFD